jgi:diguanylate cyclase (GGDEF)-like protein/putative nucleotidyltransferase with HDIG domain
VEPVGRTESIEEDREGPSPVPAADQRTGPDAAISGIAHLLVSQDEPETVLEAVADALAELVPYDTLSLYEADPPLRVLRPVLVRDRYAEEILALGPRAYGVGIVGIAADSESPVHVNDVHLDPRSLQVPGTPLDPESMIAVPLLARGILKGVLALYRSGEGHHFSDEEFGLAIRFAEMAAFTIDNAEIRARLENEQGTDQLTGLYNHRYFHERLAEESRRAVRRRSTVGLLIFDIDGFRRLNDTYGHRVGDEVLMGIASVARSTCRAEDVICRIGGEEFGVILVGSTLEDARALAERLRRAVSAAALPGMDRVTVSVGVAEGPRHAASSRELTACAQLALLDAKETGRDRVRVYRDPNEALGPGAAHEASGDPGSNGAGGSRSVAQLRMLHSLSAKLNRINVVREIGEAITAELRSLIDYHNCRIHLLQDDGVTLVPITFRGELGEYQLETYDTLITRVGQGITGHVAETGESYLTPNAVDDPHATTIVGTNDVDESMLAVPLRYGDRVVGTIVLSKLGIAQFDDEDKRLLEVLASNAAVAFENARLFQEQRAAAEAATALLGLSQALTRVTDVDAVLTEAFAALPGLLGCRQVGVFIRERDRGAYRLVKHRGFARRFATRLSDYRVDAGVAEAFVGGQDQPMILSGELLRDLPERHLLVEELRDALVAPMRWEPDGMGCLVVVAPEREFRFTERHLQLARGIADITSLALGNAQRFDDLERAYLSTVEALANALEAQDAYTEAHCRALAELAMTIGADLGLGGERLKHLQLGALFHDIGKIGVPSEIIRKPGPLTADERRMMEQHTIIGEQILEPVPFLQAVRPVVRSSHERWDGHGYPDGLRGEGIPMESRIVFVCDAFHAMTTNRPYRAALPTNEAVRRLKLAAGTQFDPQVVAAFVKALGEGRVEVHPGPPVA